MCWLWVCCTYFVEGVIRESLVVLSAVSVSAVGFVDGGVLLSSLLKESSFAPAVGGLWGLQRARRFLFLCFWFGVMSSAGVER